MQTDPGPENVDAKALVLTFNYSHKLGPCFERELQLLLHYSSSPLIQTENFNVLKLLIQRNTSLLLKTGLYEDKRQKQKGENLKGIERGF